MEEALKATKILAEDCRNRGTAFRLGVCLFFSCAKDILLSTDISRLSNILIYSRLKNSGEWLSVSVINIILNTFSACDPILISLFVVELESLHI